MKARTMALTSVVRLSSKTFFAGILCLGLVFFLQKAVWAETGSSSLSLSSSKIFERMLKSSKEGNAEKVLKALSLLKPLAEDVSKSNSIDVKANLEQAGQSGDAELLVKEVRRFIALSVKLRMDANVENEMDRRQVAANIKEAYKDYLVLDPFIRKKDFDLSKKFKMGFRRANATASNRDKLRAPCEEICLLLEQKILKEFIAS